MHCVLLAALTTNAGVTKMSPSPLTDIYDQWAVRYYQVRVRGSESQPTFLWGSAGIIQAITFPTPLILHVHNDTFGETISLQTQSPGGGSLTQYGTLEPGECVSIPIQTVSGVGAFCDPRADVPESTVTCAISSH
jgi:hypothetical protein